MQGGSRVGKTRREGPYHASADPVEARAGTCRLPPASTLPERGRKAGEMASLATKCRPDLTPAVLPRRRAVVD